MFSVLAKGKLVAKAESMFQAILAAEKKAKGRQVEIHYNCEVFTLSEAIDEVCNEYSDHYVCQYDRWMQAA